MNIDIDPIERLRTEAANRAKKERAELIKAYQGALAPDITATEAQGQELEERIAEHSKWVGKNIARIEALLPRTLASLSAYEAKRDLYRNQISSVLAETKQVSVNSLWGRRSDGQRDPSAFKAVVAGVKLRLGSCRGLAGQLHRNFLQIEAELVALEKRGFGLQPEPVPLTRQPPPPPLSVITNDGGGKIRE